jgi:hypothetical protein
MTGCLLTRQLPVDFVDELDLNTYPVIVVSHTAFCFDNGPLCNDCVVTNASVLKGYCGYFKVINDALKMYIDCSLYN